MFPWKKITLAKVRQSLSHSLWSLALASHVSSKKEGVVLSFQTSRILFTHRVNTHTHTHTERERESHTPTHTAPPRPRERKKVKGVGIWFTILKIRPCLGNGCARWSLLFSHQGDKWQSMAVSLGLNIAAKSCPCLFAVCFVCLLLFGLVFVPYHLPYKELRFSR